MTGAANRRMSFSVFPIYYYFRVLYAYLFFVYFHLSASFSKQLLNVHIGTLLVH